MAYLIITAWTIAFTRRPNCWLVRNPVRRVAWIGPLMDDDAIALLTPLLLLLLLHASA